MTEAEKQALFDALVETLTEGHALTEMAVRHVSHGGPTREQAEDWLRKAAEVLRRARWETTKGKADRPGITSHQSPVTDH